MTETHCQYCNFDEYDVLDKNDFGVILPEPNALSKGHCVIIPLRHVSSFFDITDKERKSLMSLLNWHVMNSNYVINLQAFILVLMTVKYLGMCLNTYISILFHATKTKS